MAEHDYAEILKRFDRWDRLDETMIATITHALETMARMQKENHTVKGKLIAWDLTDGKSEVTLQVPEGFGNVALDGELLIVADHKIFFDEAASQEKKI